MILRLVGGQWRQPVGSAAFSLIGQIHTLSTPAALGHLQDLVTEPVQPWDAVICSSRAGRDAVEQVLDSREKQIAWRTGSSPDRLRSQRPRLPVIPLPLPPESLEFTSSSSEHVRHKLGIDSNHAVVIWLGRLSLPKLILAYLCCWRGSLVNLDALWYLLSVDLMTNLLLMMPRKSATTLPVRAISSSW